MGENGKSVREQFGVVPPFRLFLNGDIDCGQVIESDAGSMTVLGSPRTIAPLMQALFGQEKIRLRLRDNEGKDVGIEAVVWLKDISHDSPETSKFTFYPAP